MRLLALRVRSFFLLIAVTISGLSGTWVFFCSREKSSKSSWETIAVAKQLEQKIVWSSKENASGKHTNVWKMIWLGGSPLKMATKAARSLVSWVSALFTACLFRGPHSTHMMMTTFSCFLPTDIFVIFSCRSNSIYLPPSGMHSLMIHHSE